MQKERNDKIIDHWLVQKEVMRLHRNQQDFDDGKILDRLDRFNGFVKAKIPLTIIKLDEFEICEEAVERCMSLYLAKGSCPPIVFDAIDNSIIDGLQRANALARLGVKEIDAYVGTADYEEPRWAQDLMGNCCT